MGPAVPFVQYLGGVPVFTSKLGFRTRLLGQYELDEFFSPASTEFSVSPALNVIAAVERRPVPGVQLMGETGSLLNVDYADSVNPAPNWITLGSISLTSPSQYWFDLTLPLPPQRFYRASEAAPTSVMPTLDLHLIPALTLTGAVGGKLQVEGINQFGPTDSWFTLDTVTLTNASQLYFDVSVIGQPARLWRLVTQP